jgi:hypothetical protein
LTNATTELLALHRRVKKLQERLGDVLATEGIPTDAHAYLGRFE